jgi:glycosyltransferase involved in cell wall biosynthesis
MNEFNLERIPESIIGAETVVVVPVFGSHDIFFESAISIVLNTPCHIPVIFQFDPHPNFETKKLISKIKRRLRELSKSDFNNIFFYVNLVRKGFVNQANFAFSTYENSNIILINSDVVVGEKYSETIILLLANTDCATVSVLTNHGSILTLEINVPENYEKIADFTNRINFNLKTNPIAKFPIIPIPVGHCLGISRRALQICGNFDNNFGLGYGEEVDFGLRVSNFGFNNYLADDTWVFHAGSRSFRNIDGVNQKVNDFVNDMNHPNYLKYRARKLFSVHHPLSLTLRATKAKIEGVKLGINASHINSGNTGTYLVMKNLIKHLTKSKKVSEVYLILDLTDYKTESFKLAHFFKDKYFVKLLDINAHEDDFSQIDVTLNLSQVFDLRTWDKIFIKSYRSIIWQLDNIFYLNSDYGINFEHWDELTAGMSTSLVNADGIAYLSGFVEAQMKSIGFEVTQNRGTVIYPGVEDSNDSESESTKSQVINLVAPFILVLGTSFKHKNRLYALQIFKEISKDWEGIFILAGPEPLTGSSNLLESEFIAALDDDLKKRIIDLGRVGESEKNFLLNNAELVLFPSITEGFGLIPFEALIHGTPTITSRGGSLNEISPKNAKFLSLGNLNSDVIIVKEILKNQDSRQRQIEAWKDLYSNFNWAHTAEQFVNFALKIMSLPQRTDKTKYFQNPPLKLGIEEAKLRDIFNIRLRKIVRMKLFLIHRIMNRIKYIFHRTKPK